MTLYGEKPSEPSEKFKIILFIQLLEGSEGLKNRLPETLSTLGSQPHNWASVTTKSCSYHGQYLFQVAQ